MLELIGENKIKRVSAFNTNPMQIDWNSQEDVTIMCKCLKE